MRDRRGDLRQLVTYFISLFSRRFGKRIDGISQDTMDRLARYAWPGNIRELSSVIERAVVLSEEGKITPAVLPPELRDEPASFPSKGLQLPPQGVDFERVEESLLRQAVERSGGVHTRGAELLRMSYKTYIYRLKKFGIIPS